MAQTPINLNKARKARAKTARKRQADRNAVLHGMPKAQRDRLAAAETRWKAKVDGARLTRDDTDDAG